MSPEQELLNLAGAESESKTLFDELAGLVPAERQAEYYRVIAHTRTLSPNDEMLRILEAMGILALLTRETPAEIAAERKSLRKILEASASQANAVEKRMEEYTSLLESRLTHLPKELETGLDPPRIAKLLGESLRQCFQQSGLPDTARALDQCCSEMNSVQEQLVNVLREVAHPARSGRRWAFLIGIVLYGADMIALIAMFSLWAFGVHAFFVFRWFQGQKALKDINDAGISTF
jgi:hypothetical protein